MKAGRWCSGTRTSRSTSEIQAAAGTTGGFGYVVKVPLAAIAPGSYVLAIEVRSRLDTDKPVRHETAFNVCAERRPHSAGGVPPRAHLDSRNFRPLV